MAEKQNVDTLDLLKYLSAFLVVFTHIAAFHNSLPLGVAVSRFTIPQYYMISSYFFFKRIKKYPCDAAWRKKCLLDFVKRIMSLYLCWLLAQAPLMYAFGGWYAFGYEESDSIAKSLLILMKNFLLGNTFPASWYLMALLLGTVTVTWLDRWVHNTGLLIIGFLCFLICCSSSGYLNIVQRSIQLFYPPTSFLSSLLWLTVGKMTAEDNRLIRRIRELTATKKAVILAFTAGVFFTEFLICMNKGWAGNTDAMLSLIPVCPVIFLSALDSRRQIPHAVWMRGANTVMYCSHGMLLTLLSRMGRLLGVNFEVMPMALLWYVLTVGLCTILAAFLIWLQKKPKFGWLSCFW